MDEALDLSNYLPVNLKTQNEQDYVSFLWMTFEESYNSANYQFAFLAYHMLMMSFVYFNIWQIRQIYSDDFEKALIGFNRDDERRLRNASPFTFSEVNERTVLRLFRLIGCDDSRIGNYRKLVDDRNDVAHANGNIYFNTQHEVDTKIQEVLRAVEDIQTHSRPIISRCYENFLLQSHNPDEREFPDSEDQIREVLVHENYISQKDIEVCVNFDISDLEEDNRDAIETLHNTLCEIYAPA